MDTRAMSTNKRPQYRRGAKVLAIGSDNRKIYTKDADARAGHRSATNTRRAGPYVGRELHTGVAVPAIQNTNTTTWVKFGRDVPQVIVTAALVPAGSHRGEAVLDLIREAHRAGLCADVVADAGYTLSAERFVLPLQAAGIPLTLRPKSFQLREGARIGGARVLDGQLFSEFVPDDLVDLQLPGRKASPDERNASIQQMERRAAFRYGRHKAPGLDGTTRWVGPFHAGRVRSRNLPWTMRRSRKGPLVEVPNGRKWAEPALLVPAGQLPLQQRTIVGTRAWWADWGRRNPVESVNSALHGDFISIGKHYVRLSDSGRIDGLLAHGLAGYNRWCMNQWRRVNRLLPPDDPDALPPESAKRKPRAGRAARYEDFPALGKGPPRSG